MKSKRNALESFNFTEIKTPFFLFSEKKIAENYKKFKVLFRNSSVHYSLKANSEKKLLEILISEGSGFEAASIHELDKLKKVSADPKGIIYGSSVKPASAIKKFFKYGVRTYAFDSPHELEKIAENAPGSNVYVRVVVNDSGSVFKFSEKFGTDAKNISEYLRRAKDLGLKPYGVSFHVGSQASDPKAWVNALKIVLPHIKELHRKGLKVPMLNIGGGYPCQYSSKVQVPDLKIIANSVNNELKKHKHIRKVLLEPGRGIVGDTGVLVASVIGLVKRRKRRWLFLDVGVYNGLFETMAYQGSTNYEVNHLKEGNTRLVKFALAGPTGDSPDVISRDVLLPQDINVGDRLLFKNVGAYSLVATSPFNGFPRPKVYYS